VTADVDLSPEELEGLYGGDYFHGAEYHDYVGERALHERHFRTRLQRLLRYVPHPQTKRLFEIGCAYGFFLDVARGCFANVAGIDISRDAVAHAAGTLGLTVHAGDYLGYDITDPVDVICLWDTIEHLPQPHLYLERAAMHLTEGGVLALTTGDIGSMMARLRGARWRQIHPPTHLHYFSRDTLERLLRRHGFEIEYCGYEGMYRSLDTMAYIVLALKHRRPGLYRLLRRTGLLEHAVYLNLYDIVFVVASRPGRRSRQAATRGRREG
jgi:SAM-dependent methyltransferase